jgi:hypothetical protein
MDMYSTVQIEIHSQSIDRYRAIPDGTVQI